jgi:hypothetical protein
LPKNQTGWRHANRLRRSRDPLAVGLIILAAVVIRSQKMHWASSCIQVTLLYPCAAGVTISHPATRWSPETARWRKGRHVAGLEVGGTRHVLHSDEQLPEIPFCLDLVDGPLPPGIGRDRGLLAGCSYRRDFCFRSRLETSRSTCAREIPPGSAIPSSMSAVSRGL